jgi:hypothetical protein
MNKNRRGQESEQHLNRDINSINAELNSLNKKLGIHPQPKHIMQAIIMLAALLVITTLGILLFKTGITGWIVAGDGHISYSQELGLNVTESSEETFVLEQHTELFNLKSLKLSGHLKGEGSFTAYLEDSQGNRHLVLDEEAIAAGILPHVTAHVINVPEGLPIAETPEDRIITTILDHHTGTPWDPNDDGIAYIEDGVVDLTVELSVFNWAVDESKLCTRWIISSLDAGIDTMVCNGAADCCALSGVAPEEAEWNTPLYIFHGKYGATEDNTVTAQVVFLNQSVGEETYFESTVGTIDSLPVKFVEKPIVEFTDVCAETCTLPDGLNIAEYTLVFELDYGVELFIESMTYALEDLTVDIVAEEDNVTVELDAEVKDSEGETVPVIVEFIDDTGEVKAKKEKKAKKVEVTKGKYKVKLNFTDENAPIDLIELNDFDVSENTTEFINVDDVPETGEFAQFVEVYAIDPTSVNFTSADVTVTATGTVLYKCKEWNFTTQECYGIWRKIMDIVPGQEYTFVLTPEDPAYGEIRQPNATEGIDAFVNQNVPDQNYGSNTMLIGAESSGNYAATLVKFDVSHIPGSANVTSAKLKLYFYDSPTNPSNGINLSTRLVTSGWDESTVTWNNRPAYSDQYSDIVTLTNSYGWVEWDVTDGVQRWVNGSNTNYGSAIVPDTVTTSTDKRFYSSDHSNSSLHPILEVNYTTGDLPNVTLVWPQNNSQHGDGDNYIGYTVESNSTISSCSLMLNGTVSETDSTITKNILQRFKKTISNEFDYEIVINCTDSGGVTGTSETVSISINASKADFYGWIEKADTSRVNVTLEFKQGGVVQASNTGKVHVLVLDDGIYNITVSPVSNHSIKSVTFKNINITEGFTKIVDLDLPSNKQGYNNLYAIDPTSLSFSQATVVVTAENITNNTVLYKCSSWNFTTQNCTGGNWTLFQIDLVPGEDYNFTLTPDDPGFAEQPGGEGKDTWLYLSNPNTNYETDDEVQVRGNDNRRVLIEFNLSSIPSGATIENATMELYVTSKGSGTPDIIVYRVNNSWTEDGTTWNSRNGTENWDTAGGDYDTIVWANTTLTDVNLWASWNITDLVQNWVNGTYTNYGMILRDMTDSTNIWKFASSDHINASLRPKINITYSETEAPQINLIQIPTNIRENSSLDITVNATDSAAVDSVFININGANYSMSQSISNSSQVITLSPAAKGTYESNSISGGWTNAYDQRNDTYAKITYDTRKLMVKTPGVSAIGTVDYVKIKVVHSANEGEVNCSLHWALSAATQGQGNDFTANTTMQVSEFDVTSERNWSLSDFNSAEIHINKTGNKPFIHEVWLEINYTTVSDGNIWNATIDASSWPAGTYNYTAYANDTSGNTANQTGNLTILPQLVLMNVTVKDANGTVRETNVEIYDVNDEIEFNETINESVLTSVEAGAKEIVVEPNNSAVQQISFAGVNVNSDTEGVVDIDDPTDDQGYNNLYAIDPTALNFTNATVTVTASNTSTNKILYKCADWNFTTQTCSGEWMFSKSIGSGQQYTFMLTPDDPGFGEIGEPGNLEIYRVQPMTVENDNNMKIGVVVYNPTESDITIGNVSDTWSIDKIIKDQSKIISCSPSCTADGTEEKLTWDGDHVIPAEGYSIFTYTADLDNPGNGIYANVTFSNNDTSYRVDNVYTNDHTATAYLTISTDGSNFSEAAGQVQGAFNQTFTAKLEEVASDRNILASQYAKIIIPAGWTALGTNDSDVSIEGSTVIYDIPSNIKGGFQTFTFYATAPNSDGSWLFNGTLNGTDESGYGHNDLFELLVTTNSTDSAAPTWSSNKTSPAMPATYSSGAAYQFNVTWNDVTAIDVVLFEHNFTGTLTNYSITGNNSAEYYYNYTDLVVGSYLWRMYANDTYGYTNQSDQWVYTVGKASSEVNLLLNGTDSNLTIERLSDANITATTVTGDNVAIYLYRNGTLINSGISPLENVSQYTEHADYNVTVVYNGSHNYTSSSETHWLFVRDTTPPATVTGLSESAAGKTWIMWNWTNPSDPDFNATILYLDGTNIANTSNDYYNASGLEGYTSYQLTVQTKDTNGNVNTTNVSDNAMTLDNIPPEYSNIVDQNGTAYSAGGSYQFNITWIDNIGVDAVTLEFNGTNYTDASNSGDVYYKTLTDLAAGTYSYTWYAEDFLDNVNNTEAVVFVIVKATPTTSVYLNGSSSNLSIGYGTASNASATTSAGSVTLYRNGTNVSNPEIASLGVGYYNYTALTSEDENYTASSTTLFLEVNRTASSVSLLLNGSSANLSIGSGSDANISASRTTGEGDVYLYRNGTLLGSGTSVENVSTYTVDTVYNITVVYPETQNYSTSQQTWWLTVYETDPPGNVTSLTVLSSGLNFIYWVWTNPTDSDYDHTEVWLNNEFKSNTTNEYYYATSLNHSTNYTISLRTVDTLGNIGDWVNDSHMTDLSCTENWVAYYGGCRINDTRIKYYNDTAECGTTFDLPGDNGTTESCDCVVSTNFNGTTTNLTGNNLSNLENVVLEIWPIGTVQFQQNITIERCLDLDTHAGIGEYYTSIDSSQISEFNKSANITLYNVSFVDPQIMADGSLCNSSVCTLINYSGGIFVFNVTHFTNYSVEEGMYCGDGSCNNGESCSSCAADCGSCSSGGGGGGGGGGGAPPKEEACVPNWQCYSWGVCDNNQQSRACFDANACNNDTDMPPLERACVAGCAERWACGDWGACTEAGVQTRTCNDLAKCGSEERKPETVQPCEYDFCHDGKKNRDELGIDCGGSCRECTEEEEKEAKQRRSLLTGEAITVQPYEPPNPMYILPLLLLLMLLIAVIGLHKAKLSDRAKKILTTMHVLLIISIAFLLILTFDVPEITGKAVSGLVSRSDASGLIAMITAAALLGGTLAYAAIRRSRIVRIRTPLIPSHPTHGVGEAKPSMKPASTADKELKRIEQEIINTNKRIRKAKTLKLLKLFGLSQREGRQTKLSEIVRKERHKAKEAEAKRKPAMQSKPVQTRKTEQKAVSKTKQPISQTEKVAIRKRPVIKTEKPQPKKISKQASKPGFSPKVLEIVMKSTRKTAKEAEKAKQKPATPISISRSEKLELKKYIFHALSEGFRKEQVKTVLMQNDWPEQIIDLVFEEIKPKKP